MELASKVVDESVPAGQIRKVGNKPKRDKKRDCSRDGTSFLSSQPPLHPPADSDHCPCRALVDKTKLAVSGEPGCQDGELWFEGAGSKDASKEKQSGVSLQKLGC